MSFLMAGGALLLALLLGIVLDYGGVGGPQSAGRHVPSFDSW